MPTIRAITCLFLITVLTLALLPLQIIFKLFGLPIARTLPGWYHRRVLEIIGLHVTAQGEIVEDNPSFIVSNHISWLDIPIISSIAPLSFVAKSEVAGWPLIGYLAKLQNCIFVERGRKTAVTAQSSEIQERLIANDHIVLFPEGTSGDGNRVLSFKTSLFSAVKPSNRNAVNTPHDIGSRVVVQTCTLSYSHVHGLPVDRVLRPIIAWYGDMEMAGHVWKVLKSGLSTSKSRLANPGGLKILPTGRILPPICTGKFQQITQPSTGTETDSRSGGRGFTDRSQFPRSRSVLVGAEAI